MDSNDQPGNISDAGDPFVRSQLSDSHIPSMIEFVDRHVFVSLCFAEYN